MTSPSYKRILLKLSGEVLMGASEQGGGLSIDPAVTARVAGEIKDAKTVTSLLLWEKENNARVPF